MQTLSESHLLYFRKIVRYHPCFDPKPNCKCALYTATIFLPLNSATGTFFVRLGNYSIYSLKRNNTYLLGYFLVWVPAVDSDSYTKDWLGWVQERRWQRGRTERVTGEREVAVTRGINKTVVSVAARAIAVVSHTRFPCNILCRTPERRIAAYWVLSFILPPNAAHTH